MMQTVVSLLVALVCAQCVASQLATCSKNATFVTCKDGKWPETSETAPDIAIDTTDLFIFNVSIPDVTKVRPLPAITALKTLIINSVSSPTAFPLAALLAPLAEKRSAIVSLTVDQINFPTLEAAHLAGLTGLESLTLGNDGLTEIKPDAFKDSMKIKSLTVWREDKLAILPWEALRPLSGSLSSLILTELKALTQIVAPTTTVLLPHLRTLVIMSTGLTAVPETVVSSIKTTTVADTVSVGFKSNPNPCSNCAAVAPLVTWIKDVNTKGDSSLALSCKASNGAEPEQTGKASDWKTKNDCIPDEVVTTPTPNGAVSTVSIAGTSIFFMTLITAILA